MQTKSNEYITVSREWMDDLLLLCTKLRLPIEVFNMEKVTVEQLGTLSAMLGHIRSISFIIELSERFDNEQ